LCYGVALLLAASSTDDQRWRGMAIGLTTASFAVTGLILSLLNQGPFDSVAPRETFAMIGGIQLLIGVISFFFIGHDDHARSNPAHTGTEVSRVDYCDIFFVGLTFGFFAVCFVGLMTVSHSSGITEDRGLPAAFAGYAPLLVNAGYIAFGISLAALAARLPIHVALATVSVGAFAGVACLLSSQDPAIFAAGLAMVGGSLGASASVYPIVIGRHYGIRNIGNIYGKVLIAYGASGFAAPWLTGILFVQTGSYSVALWVAVVLSLLSVLVVLFTTRYPKLTD
jgi:MFS transporter, OFA family, oxalate/formate antiporter